MIKNDKFMIKQEELTNKIMKPLVQIHFQHLVNFGIYYIVQFINIDL